MNISELKSHILFLENQMIDPGFRNSQEIAELLAHDFIEFGSSGRIYNKQEVLTFIQNSPIAEIKIDDFDIKFLSNDVILATYKISGFNESKSEVIYSLRSSIWKKFGDKWRIVFHQGTVVNR
jgi:hypothetical protein